MDDKDIVKKRRILLLSPVNCERTNLFPVKSDLDPLPNPPPTLCSGIMGMSRDMEKRRERGTNRFSTFCSSLFITSVYINLRYIILVWSPC